MELLDRIKTAQDQHGWSDGEFVARLGMSQSVWSRIKNGIRPLDNVRFLRAVAQAMPELRWPIAEYILGGTQDGTAKRGQGADSDLISTARTGGD